MRPRPPGLRRLTRGARWLALLALLPSPSVAQTLDEALSLLSKGEYESAIDALEDITETVNAPAAFVALADALAAIGRYDDAAVMLRDAPPGLANELSNTLGVVLFATGRVAEARTAFERAVDEVAQDRNVARVNLAILEFRYGDRDEAMKLFDEFIDIYNGGQELGARDLTAVAQAVRYLSATNADLLHDALRAADEAIAADPTSLDARKLTGELFLRTYQGIDADAAFDNVLNRNPRDAEALLGKARTSEFNQQGDALERVQAALDVNPNLVAARVFKAKLHLAAENHEDAREELRLALEANPRSLEAMAMLAASYYLRGEREDYARIRDDVIAMSPEYPNLFTTVADVAARNRKYREAAELASKAIAVDERSWTAWGLLGMNQLRLGEISEGIASLDVAFEGDPFNPWYKNTLDLTDTFEHYDVLRTERFEILLHESESELLAPYVEEMANAAFEGLQKRYGDYTPPLPIRIEIFPSHADFSVRTVGLAGIGALGVSFGRVIAMDSPSARALGEFNWASTLWHEMAHVFHLGLTRHEVPRWFSEGLAVHEQHLARPGWGHQPSPDFLRVHKQGLMLPVSQLNEGFVRPRYPAQVVHSYFQASVVFEYIEGRWGLQAILDMMSGYRDGRTTRELVESVLGLEMEELDKAFVEYFEARFERPLASLDEAPPITGVPNAALDPPTIIRLARENPSNFLARLSAGIQLFEEGRTAEAEPHLRAAVRLFPEYGGPGSAYWYLSQIHEARGELSQAAAALARLNARNESDYRARIEQADILGRLGDFEAAANALESGVLIFPYEIEVHRKLAEAHASQGNTAGVVRERRAVVALDPTDRAEALYLLAVAYRADDDLAAARRAVLRALDVAPNYEEALELLLDLRSGTESHPLPSVTGRTP
ncbi:MAG: hypothetical protein BMS9Abin29_0269 [Gemmatimonadota bacterium]|nr:MAG: hypothetical protein BMS9Abin29_0269 [Gemmatimonadota bacterium]